MGERHVDDDFVWWIEAERTADADNGFRAVVEGDATLAMLAHALRQQGIPLSAATQGIQQMGGYLDLNALVRGEKLDDARGGAGNCGSDAVTRPNVAAIETKPWWPGGST